jgi:uncharacterized protein YukE
MLQRPPNEPIEARRVTDYAIRNRSKLMTDRVLTTAQAREAIQKLQQIINGPLLDQIRSLDNQGRMLADSSVWDGNLAQQFRSEWPVVHQTLMKTQQTLDELRQNVQRINQNIMTAGGNQ